MDKIKRNKIILSVFISLLMITSIAGFIGLPESNPGNDFETKTFNGIEFQNINNRWVSVDNNQIALFFDPEIIGKQNVLNIQKLNSGEKIYFSTDQNSTDNQRIYQEINSLTALLKPRAVNSCYEDSEQCRTLPLKTCEDAKDLNKVVVIKKEKITNISYNNNCLEITGTETDIVKFIDQLILGLLS